MAPKKITGSKETQKVTAEWTTARQRTMQSVVGREMNLTQVKGGRVTKPLGPTKKQSSADKARLEKALSLPAKSTKTESAKPSTSRNTRDDSPIPELTLSSDPTKHSQGSKTYLHLLPGELRNRIYRYIGIRSTRFCLAGSKEPALAIAIPDLAPEIHSIVIACNHLECTIYSDFETIDGAKPQKYHTGPRGDRYGAGNLAAERDAWMLNVSKDAVAVRHLTLAIHEMGGHPIGDFHITVKNDKTSGKAKAGGRMMTNGLLSKEKKKQTDVMADLARMRMNHIVAQKKESGGFSWDEIRDIGKSFHSLDRAKYDLKENKTMKKAEKQRQKQKK